MTKPLSEVSVADTLRTLPVLDTDPKDVVEKLRRTNGTHSNAVHVAIRHIEALHRKLKGEEKLITRIRQLESLIRVHDDRLAQRDKAVALANADLHRERLENVRARREITSLKNQIRAYMGDAKK